MPREHSSYWYGEGNLTGPIEVRYLPSGTPVGTTRIAIREVWTDPKKGVQSHTSFFSLVFWGEAMVERAKPYEKGQNVHVEGIPKTRSFQSGGYKRTVTEFTIVRIFAIESTDSDNHNALTEEEASHGNDDTDTDDSAGWPER